MTPPPGCPSLEEELAVLRTFRFTGKEDLRRRVEDHARYPCCSGWRPTPNLPRDYKQRECQ